MRRDRIARAHAGIDAHPRGRMRGVLIGIAHESHMRGQAEMREAADRGQKAFLGILGIQTRFDRMAIDLQFGLTRGQGLPGRDAQLPFDQIMARDHFGDRVLDLQPRVHFHEKECISFGDELDRAGTHIADRLGRGDRRLAHRAAPLGRHAGRRRFFEYFLMAALHRAIALEQIDAIALGIGEDLHLDMARPAQIFLDQHPVVAESVDRFTFA